MQKTERQKLIIEIITDHSISTQEELAIHLAKLGHTVTQASISRDIDELGIAKSGGKYVIHVIQNGVRSPGVELVSISPAGDNLIVAKCRPGLASAAAVIIDSAAISSIAGTIAGDDTIFIAVSNTADRDLTIEAIKRLLQ